MSSGSDSDDDYVPGEPQQLSEEESADDETEQQYEKESEHKAIKRKLSENKSKKKCKLKKSTRNDVDQLKETKDELVAELPPEDEKKRQEDLWAKFLEGTDSKPAPKVSEKLVAVTKTLKTTPTQTTVNDDDDKNREKRIFEFAGETIVVENDIIKEKIPTKSKEETPTGSKSLETPPRGRKSGGLAHFVGQLNKKNTLSTLEKSKLDWTTYKKQEGVEEEIQSHNKGKHGFLDRRDFLERADVRQYEIERDLRMSKRSKR